MLSFGVSLAAEEPGESPSDMRSLSCDEHYQNVRKMTAETVGESRVDEVRKSSMGKWQACQVRADFPDQGLLFILAVFPDTGSANEFWMGLGRELEGVAEETRSENPGREMQFRKDTNEYYLLQITPGIVGRGGFQGNMKCRRGPLTVACAGFRAVPGSNFEVRADSAPYWPYPRWREYVESLPEGEI